MSLSKFTHLNRMDSHSISQSILINWISPFPILRLFGGNFHNEHSELEQWRDRDQMLYSTALFAHVP